MNVQVNSLLGQTEGERKKFFGGDKKEEGTATWDFPSTALGCYKK